MSADAVFRRLVESVQHYAIIALDASATIVTWSDAARQLTGHDEAEAIGRPIAMLYPAEDVIARRHERDFQSVATLGAVEVEGWRVRKDGSTFWASASISLLAGDDDAGAGFAVVMNDRTASRRVEDDRIEQLALERNCRAKNAFLAMLSHELRNPLAPITTAVELLRLRGIDGKEVDIITRQTAHMSHLVDDLLDVSRIEHGGIELTRTGVDVRGTIARAAERTRASFEQRGHRLEVTAWPDPVIVNADRDRLVQVFEHLLANAAKYTLVPSVIRVAVDIVHQTAVVRISDPGIGIERELKKRLFSLFTQAEQGSDRAAGGLGLGLALVRSIVNLHGGWVDVESEGRDRGSQFTVTLPLAQPADLVRGADAPSCATRILVVDDNEDAASLLADFLTGRGFEVKTAFTSHDALATALDFDFQVAILDLGLPEMSGYELAERLRLGPACARHLVALSGYGQPEDMVRSREAGFERHLVKPVDLRRLLDTLAELSDVPRASSPMQPQ